MRYKYLFFFSFFHPIHREIHSFPTQPQTSNCQQHELHLRSTTTSSPQTSNYYIIISLISSFHFSTPAAQSQNHPKLPAPNSFILGFQSIRFC
ncbi:hypothetical protein RchiOBHm_Chr5g0055181 [Rosa chinensis]|uniref:Uncharacterized protein n=1 Tax=Rosa chinensis TaxID=74649 RepID=A0A2P6QGB9_ROSCH|nr:hypothetical protein RchiOBHm_Chr5g0055181 [Rosa chinensis]